MTKETKATAIAAGIVALISLGFGYVINDELDTKAVREAEKATLEGEIDVLEKKVATIDALTQELDNLKANFSQYIKILPSPEIATHERLMDLVQEKSGRTSFQIEKFDFRQQAGGAAAAARRAKTAFQEVEISLNAKGTFEQFLRFLNSLERHESFVRVNSFTCTAPTTPATDDQGKVIYPLTVALNISTFRYDSGGR
ncbi:MAG: type 4a pilus biogenesis protein PilO [Planctomycetota bacterium]|nr:type 4a pilus biogenesis protein PilO [Planctomycetota bacterium]